MSLQSTDLIADNSGRFFGKSLDFCRDISTVTRPWSAARAPHGSSIGGPARGAAFATNSAATGSIGTKNGSAYSAEATLAPGFTFRCASLSSAPAP